MSKSKCILFLMCLIILFAAWFIFEINTQYYLDKSISEKVGYYDKQGKWIKGTDDVVKEVAIR